MERIESYERWKDAFGDFHVAKVFFRHEGVLLCDMERCEAKTEGIAAKSVAARLVTRFARERMQEARARRERELARVEEANEDETKA